MSDGQKERKGNREKRKRVDDGDKRKAAKASEGETPSGPKVAKAEVSVEKQSRWQMRDYFKFAPDYDPPEWDPENDEEYEFDEITYYLGKRRSSKTTKAMIIALQRRFYYPIVICYTNTAKNGHWQQLVPKKNVIDGFPEKHAQKVLDLGIASIQEYNQVKHETGKYRGNPYIKVFGEDLISTGVLRKSMAARTMFFNGRHHGISADILSQDYAGLTPGQRDNIDRLIIFRTKDGRTRDALDKMFGASFLPLLDRVTAEPYMALVINCKASCPDDQVVKKYKGDIKYLEKCMKNNIVLGNKRLWGVETNEEWKEAIEEQKAEFPYSTKKQSRQSLKRKFNESIQASDGEDEVQAEAQEELFSAENSESEEVEESEDDGLERFPDLHKCQKAVNHFLGRN